MHTSAQCLMLNENGEEEWNECYIQSDAMIALTLRATHGTFCSCAPIHPPTWLFSPMLHSPLSPLLEPSCWNVTEHQDVTCSHSAVLQSLCSKMWYLFLQTPCSSLSWLFVKEKKKIDHPWKFNAANKKKILFSKEDSHDSPSYLLLQKWRLVV